MSEHNPQDESLYKYWYDRTKTKTTKEAFIAGRHSAGVKHVKSRRDMETGKTYDVFETPDGEQFEAPRG